MGYERGIDVIVVGYHQPVDCRQFHHELFQVRDEIPWDAWYISVEATPEDIALGDEVWGSRRHQPVEQNCGHAAACNRGACWGKHDTLFFCNADARVYPGVMDRLYRTLWSDPSNGVVGPRQVDERGRLTAAGIVGTPTQPQHRGWHQVTREYQDVRPVVMVAGSLYMIKRHVWDELTECPIYTKTEEEITGMFPFGAMPGVSHYYSDTWPSYHLTAHGYRNIYEGRVTARHDWHKASPINSWVDRQMPKDREHFRRLCDAHGIEHD